MITRRMLSLLLVGSALLLPAIASAAFGDVPETNKNRNAIEYLRHTKVIEGYEDQTFKPDHSVNRAEFLKILMEAEDMQIPDTYKNCFTDVTTEWYAKYICYAKDKGWVEGYTDGSFKPWQYVNKVEALKMLLQIQGFQDELKVVDTLYLFEDTKPGEWYAPYVALARKMNLLEEEGKEYSPAKDMSRGTIAEVVFRSAVRAKRKHEAFREEDAKDLLENTGLPYIERRHHEDDEAHTASGSTIIPGTSTGSTIVPPVTPPVTPPPVVQPPAKPNPKKVPYRGGTPAVDKILLNDGVKIEFRNSTFNGTYEMYAILSTDPNTKLTWDTLKAAMKSLRVDYEAFTQIVELLEYQNRIGSLGRYVSIELLGGDMDETGSMMLDVKVEDPCYGSTTSQYFYKINVGMVEIKTLNSTAATQTCSE